MSNRKRFFGSWGTHKCYMKSELLELLSEPEELVLDAKLAYAYIILFNKIVEPNPEKEKWNDPDLTEIFKEFGISETKNPSSEVNTIWFYTSSQECKAFAFLKHIRNAISHDTIRQQEDIYHVVDIWMHDSHNGNTIMKCNCSMSLKIQKDNFWTLIVKVLKSLKNVQ